MFTSLFSLYYVTRESTARGRGGGGVLPYIGHIGIRFGLKTGIHFAHFAPYHFWYGSRGITRECMNVFIVSIPNE